MTKIITIANPQPKSGRTTCAVNLAACLAAWEEPVLLMDMDPRGGCLLLLDPNPRVQRHGLDTLIDSGTYETKNIRINSPMPGMWFIPPGPNLREAVRNKGYDNICKIISDICEQIDAYSWLIIDTPPDIGPLTEAALKVSDTIIVPFPRPASMASSVSTLSQIHQLMTLAEQIRTKGYRISISGLLRFPNLEHPDIRVEFGWEKHLDSIYLPFEIPFDPVVSEGLASASPVVLVDAMSNVSEAFFQVCRHIRNMFELD